MLREIDGLIDRRVSDLNSRLLLAAGTAVVAVLLVGAGLALDLIARRSPHSATNRARRPWASAGSPPAGPVGVTEVSVAPAPELVPAGRHAWPPPQSGAPPQFGAPTPPGSPPEDPALAQLAQWEQFGASR
jgi:hypothetical protein